MCLLFICIDIGFVTNENLLSLDKSGSITISFSTQSLLWMENVFTSARKRP